MLFRSRRSDEKGSKGLKRVELGSIFPRFASFWLAFPARFLQNSVDDKIVSALCTDLRAAFFVFLVGIEPLRRIYDKGHCEIPVPASLLSSGEDRDGLVARS